MDKKVRALVLCTLHEKIKTMFNALVSWDKEAPARAKVTADIKLLIAGFWEIRGYKGYVSNVAGLDPWEKDIASIEALLEDE